MQLLLLQPTLADGSLLGFSPTMVVPISAVLFVMYMSFRPKRRDPMKDAISRTSLVQQRALERDMQHVIVELSEMTRQMTAQIETRATKLEQIMRDADAKIAELKALADSVTEMAQSAVTSGNSDHDLTAIAHDVIASTIESAAATRPTMRLVSDNPHTEDRWAEVYRLGDEGLTLPEIARRLSRPNGEVELILALRPKPSTDAQDASRDRGNLAQSHG